MGLKFPRFRDRRRTLANAGAGRGLTDIAPVPTTMDPAEDLRIKALAQARFQRADDMMTGLGRGPTVNPGRADEAG